MSLLYISLFLVSSLGISILACVIALRATNGHISRQYVYFGMAVFFVGITVHSLIALPVVLVEHGVRAAYLGMLDRTEPQFRSWELLYFALAAGIGQELAKALPIPLELRRTGGKSPTPPYFELGLNIGLGFSLSEIMFIGLTHWQPSLAFYNILMGTFERVGATLFHMSTGGLIAFGVERGKVGYFLSISIALHTLLDAFVSLTYHNPIVSEVVEEVALFLFSLLLLVFSMLLVRRFESGLVAG